MSPLDLNTIPLKNIDEIVNCGNYLSVALKAGLIETMVWVYRQSWEVDQIQLPEFFGKLGVKVYSMSYSNFVNNYLQEIQIKQYLSPIMCLSPDFTLSKITLFFQTFKCENAFKFSAIDYGYEAIFGNKEKIYLRNVLLDFEQYSKYSFYSSKQKNWKLGNKIKILIWIFWFHPQFPLLVNYVGSKNNNFKGIDF